VFVNHAHTDHVIDAPYVAKKFNTKIYGSSSVRNVGLGQGLTEDQAVLIDETSIIQIGDFKISVFSTPHMPHFWDVLLMDGKIERPLPSPTSPWDYKVGEMYSFLIEHPEKKIFFQSIGHIYEIDPAKNVKADVLLMTIANRKTSKNLIEGRLVPTNAKTLIPLHHDNFFFPMKRNGDLDFFWGVGKDEFDESVKSRDKSVKIYWPSYCQTISF
jgi:L-ascorbate metabolism protein UlaG (beta-lactamase superfamily)